MESRIVFLDYDGVVNTKMWNERGTKASYNLPQDGKVNNFQAVQWLSEFCQKCKFDIVVTSSWREESNYKECLINGGLREGIRILGCTEQDEDKMRGDQVRDYLKEHPEIKYYIILDDDDDFLPSQREHFIKTNPEHGFCESDFHACVNLFVKMRSKKN